MDHTIDIEIEVRTLILRVGVLVVPVLVPDNVLGVAQAVGDLQRLTVVVDQRTIG